LTDAEQAMNAMFAKCSTALFESIIVKIRSIAKSPNVKLIPEIKKNKASSLIFLCLPVLNRNFEFNQKANELETKNA
jgi:hypothetical protein